MNTAEDLRSEGDVFHRKQIQVKEWDSEADWPFRGASPLKKSFSFHCMAAGLCWDTNNVYKVGNG